MLYNWQLEHLIHQMNSVVFDCDGVICDFIKGFCDWYYQNDYNKKYHDISRDPEGWNFDWSGDQAIIQKLVTEYIATKPILEIIFPEMPKIMLTLKNKYNVYIVSHYPDYQTRYDNLNKLGIYKGKHYDELYCAGTTSDKVNIVKKINPQHYVEDAPHVIKLADDAKLAINVHVPTNYKYCDNLLEPKYTSLAIYRYSHPHELLKNITGENWNQL